MVTRETPATVALRGAEGDVCRSSGAGFTITCMDSSYFCIPPFALALFFLFCSPFSPPSSFSPPRPRLPNFYYIGRAPFSALSLTSSLRGQPRLRYGRASHSPAQRSCLSSDGGAPRGPHARRTNSLHRHHKRCGPEESKLTCGVLDTCRGGNTEMGVLHTRLRPFFTRLLFMYTTPNLHLQCVGPMV